jgi:hypothetical protein
VTCRVLTKLADPNEKSGLIGGPKREFDHAAGLCGWVISLTMRFALKATGELNFMNQ